MPAFAAPLPRPPRRRGRRAAIAATTERGATFTPDGTFYRPASRVVRDLGVLSAAALARPALRVLDACSGSGVRALRYAGERCVARVVANDVQSGGLLAANVAGAARAVVRIGDARAAFRAGVYDVVDVDLFGSCGEPAVGDAVDAVTEGGLLYLCATDAVAATGRNAHVAYAAYGARVANHPAVNEQFLRMVSGGAHRAAMARGRSVRPVFSYFHAPSSTARVMLQFDPPGELHAAPHQSRLSQVGFVTHCFCCGQNGAVALADPPPTKCAACGSGGDARFVVSGPLYIGQLHDRDFVRRMLAIATERDSREDSWRAVMRLLALFEQEAPLPPLFYRLGDVGKRIGGSPPPRNHIVEALSEMGYASSPSHARERCLKTDAPYKDVLIAARNAAAGVLCTQ